jgi:hypothetical protein
MNDIYTLTLAYILLELFETRWQQSGTMMGMLVNMYEKYRQNMLYFLIFHPTYYFTIYLSMTTNYSAEILLVLFVKTFDIATKIILIRQIFEKREISRELSQVLLTPLHKLMPYIGLIVYVPLVYMGLL